MTQGEGLSGGSVLPPGSTLPPFATELRGWRLRHGSKQDEAARVVGVSRPTFTQWEGGRHLPSLDHVEQLDRFFKADGALVLSLRAARGEDAPALAMRTMTLADVFTRARAALLDHLVVVDGRPLGWRHNLVGRGRHTALSTAFGVKLLRVLGGGHVDLDGLRQTFLDARTESGAWSNRARSEPRPEVTATILDATVDLVPVADTERTLEWLENAMDPFARSRPYVLTVVLETVARLRPESEFARRLLAWLLDTRKDFGGSLLWAASGDADAHRLQPSTAHTARAVAVLKLAREYVRRDLAEVDDAIGVAVDWLLEHDDDGGMLEILEPVPESRLHDVPVRHLTSAWVLRALADAAAPEPRLRIAFRYLWECYSPPDSLWVWRSDGHMPIWMSYDAVTALRTVALSGYGTPVPIAQSGAPS